MKRIILLALLLTITLHFIATLPNAYGFIHGVFEYHASYYVVRDGKTGTPFNYSISVIVLKNTSRGVVLRVESVPTASNPLYSSKSATPPKTVITYMVEYLRPAGFRVNNSYIPFVVPRKLIEYIKHGRADSVRIEMWGYNATNISIIDVEENKTCIGMTFSRSKASIITWIQRVELCYNDDGVLVYMKSNTTRRIGDQPAEHLVYIISLSKVSASTTTTQQVTPTTQSITATTRIREEKAWSYNEAVIVFIVIGLIVVGALIIASKRK